jgi:hypothetical protein
MVDETTTEFDIATVFDMLADGELSATVVRGLVEDSDDFSDLYEASRPEVPPRPRGALRISDVGEAREAVKALKTSRWDERTPTQVRRFQRQEEREQLRRQLDDDRRERVLRQVRARRQAGAVAAREEWVFDLGYPWFSYVRWRSF